MRSAAATAHSPASAVAAALDRSGGIALPLPLARLFMCDQHVSGVRQNAECTRRFPAAFLIALTVMLCGGLATPATAAPGIKTATGQESGDSSTTATGARGTRLIPLQDGDTTLPLAAEIQFDQSPAYVTVLIEDRMGTLQSLPADSTSVAVVLTDGTRWELAADPLPEDSAGRSSRFRAALDEWPAILRDGGTPDGRVELTLRELSASGRLPSAVPGSADSEQIESSTFALLGTWCVMIVLASLAGGWIANWMEFSHTRMQIMISLVGGLMLGISLLHLLPHATGELGSIDQAVGWMMAGLVAMFLLIRTFHFHQHGPVELPREAGTVIATPCPGAPESADQSVAAVEENQADSAAAVHDHDHNPATGCGHTDHHHHHHGHDESGHAHRLSWIGIAAGLSLHTFIDGLALAASVQADADHGAVWGLFGVGTFLAILLHKPLDAVSITSLMAAGGWSTRARQTVNASFSLMCPLGAACFILGLEQFSGQQREILGAVLAFSAGVFACISLADLLPEMEFHSHNRIPLSLALLTGIAIAWAISLLEPGHAHEHHAHVSAVRQSVSLGD